jgi:hypothetical protein
VDPGLYKLVNLSTYGDAIPTNTWGVNDVALNENVYPGASKVFSFNVTAPIIPGSYLFQWRMWSYDGGLFGDASIPRYIYVQERTAGQIDDKFQSKRIISIDAGKADRL